MGEEENEDKNQQPLLIIIQDRKNTRLNSWEITMRYCMLYNRKAVHLHTN